MKYIKSINWIFTYKCNLKCTHCDIWDNPYKKELNLEKIKEIVSSKIIQDSYKYYGDFFDIAISGGEPLLINNLEEIMLKINKYLPGSIHSISTNGILTDKIIKLLIFWKKQGEKFRKINISIDGNEKHHDKQRGIKGSLKKSLETIQKIKKIFPNQIIEIKLTITKHNFHDILYISKLANKLGVFFSFKPVENMINYTNQTNINDIIFNEKEITIIEKQILKNKYILKQNNFITKEFFYKIPKYLREGLGEEKKVCSIAKDSLTIMPDGKIYSCILMKKVGDLNKSSIDTIWTSNKIKSLRNEIKQGKCPECMLMCGSFKSKEIYAK